MKEELHIETPMPSQFIKNKLFIGVTAVLVALFAYGGLMSFIYGSGVWGTSNEMPWGLLITAYVYFAVGCTGLCLLSSLAHVFHFKPFETMGVRPIILAISFMITAFAIIALELMYFVNLGIYFFISPNLKSVFILMGALYGMYLGLLFMELIFYVIGKKKLSRYFAIAAIITGVAASSNLGLVFGGQIARAYWTAPLIPIMWISSALISGAASLIILYYFVDRAKSRENSNHLVDQFRKLLGYFILVYFALNALNIFSAISSGSAERNEAAYFLLTGGYAIHFWVFEVGLLLLALIVMFLLKNSQRIVMLASAVTLVALMFARQNIVTAGQVVSLTPDGHGPINLISYTPTFVELSMAIGGFGLVLMIYSVTDFGVSFVQNWLAKKDAPAAQTTESI